jgi:hypothetical protein
MTELYSNQLAAISRLFSSSVLREMARKGRSPLFARLAQQSDLLGPLTSRARVGSLFDAAFRVLQQEGNRDEYIYKSAITRNVLLGRHSLQTASMLTEFRVGECKADVAILNGTAMVYEIKSERDSLTRLERQVAAYSRVFASVYVIAAENHADSVRTCVPKDVGLMLLSRRQNISTIRDAADRPGRTSPAAIFDCIRTAEARMILEAHGFPIPRVPNTELSAALQELFVTLPARGAHEAMVKVLKKTRNLLSLSALIAQLPPSLHSAALSMPLRKIDHARLVAAVNTELSHAMAWA